MASATFVKAAQKNIYHIGKNVEYLSEKGKRAGQMKSKLDRTIPANETDTILIAKGESYYWWQFKNRPKQFSKIRPKASELTQSNFLSQLYALDEKLSEFTAECKEDFDSFRDDFSSDIESLKDECQDSLDNMPEQLQSAPTGELLQERIDALDSWKDEVEGVECEECDEDAVREEKKAELEKEEDETDEEFEARVDEECDNAIKEKVQELVDEAINELQSTSHGL